MENLKKTRRKLGLTQSELAVLAKVNQPTISFYEKGTHYPSPVNQKKIENVLGCRVNWIGDSKVKVKEANLASAERLLRKFIGVFVNLNYAQKEDLKIFISTNIINN